MVVTHRDSMIGRILVHLRYLDERNKLGPLRFQNPHQAFREGFLISTASLLAAALIVNVTRRALRRRHSADEYHRMRWIGSVAIVSTTASMKLARGFARQ